MPARPLTKGRPAPPPPTITAKTGARLRMAPMHSDGVATATGGSALTAPLWFQYIDPLFQFLIAAMGFFVLVLTLWNKWLEIKLKRRALQEIKEAEHGETPQA